jgi:hypothetical protein
MFSQRHGDGSAVGCLDNYTKYFKAMNLVCSQLNLPTSSLSTIHFNTVTGLTSEELGYDSRQRIPTAFRSVLGRTQPPIQRVPGPFSPGL